MRSYLSQRPTLLSSDQRSALQLDVAMTLMVTAKRWRLRVADLFRESGHTGAPTVVLYFLADEPKGLTLSELANRMELSGASLTRLVQRLEKDGMVSRRRLIGDGRSWLIQMEPAGRAEIEAFEIHAAAMRKRMFEGVSDEDMAAALRVLKALAEKLTHGPDAAPAI